MAAQSGSGLQTEQNWSLVGYFPEGADAYRAIHELIDEGFAASGIGAAFRTARVDAGARPAAVREMRSVRELTERNPALSGSVGGAASGDQAVTPAGLAPGSGNAFPGAPSTPGPIPGGEIPETLPHDLPETLPHDLPSSLRSARGAQPGWLDHLKRTYGSNSTAETARNRNTMRASSQESSQKFGTGEGTLGLYPEYEYSAPVFEESFVQMGIGTERARSLSRELARGGAVVTVQAGARTAEAEAILERNHGRIRMEMSVSSGEPDRRSPVQIYGAMQEFWRSDEGLRRKAS